MAELADDTNPTRQSLLNRLRDWNDQESWQDFFDTYWKLFYSVAIQSGLTDAEAQDVVQETVISVAKKMSEYKTDPTFGSFKSWLLQITRRRIADQFRKRPQLIESRKYRPDESTRTPTIERIADPASLDLESLWEQQWERNLVDVAMERIKEQVSPKQYLWFHQQVVEKWPAKKVAEKFGVSLASVYMARYRVSLLIKKEVRKLQRKMG